MTKYQKILDFIKYHNAFTIGFGVVFLGFGASYAASPAVRESVYSREETVISVDNGLIVSADLENFNFNLKVNSVTEDETYYYVIYSYQTMIVENDIWQNKEISKTLKINKEALGSKDLGAYLTDELGENIRSEQTYLKRVQKLEKEKGESKKIIAVEYSGLIGKLIDPKEKIIDAPEIDATEPDTNDKNPIFVDKNETPQPLPSPAISDSVVEASTGATGSTLEPTPETTPEPTPETTPSLTPEATPESTLEPTPTLTPESAPESTPTPTPTQELTPIPEPTPEPAPEPTPEIVNE